MNPLKLKFTDDEVRAFTAEDVGALTEQQVAALTFEQICIIDPSMADFDHAAFEKFCLDRDAENVLFEAMSEEDQRDYLDGLAEKESESLEGEWEWD